MVKLSNPGEIDPDNISRPSIDELPPEDHQAYEDFIKECEEENKRRKEKELEEKRRWFLSHFSKIGRVISLKTRRWSFFRMKMSKLNQVLL